MAYEEYDYYNEPAGDGKSLKESLREILNGLRNEKNLREAGTSLKEALQLTPNVTESLGRGGVAQAIGTSGDLRDLRNTINSYLPKSVRNFTQAAEFLANPYATAIQQTAPTTESTLEFVPRVSAPYEGYRQHETLGEFVAPSLGYFGAKTVKALKDAPVGLSIMGPESKLWNKEMAFTAGKLEAKGDTPDEILEKTGMVRGLDNQWRSELSDQFSKLKGEGDTFGTRHGNVHPSNNRFTTPERRAEGVLVEDILDHPQLLEAYPELGKIKVEAHGSTRGEKGSYRQSKNTISIREDLSPEEARSTLLHELTHGVQGIEGMNRGANYGQLVKYFEKQQQDLLPKISELSDQMREANMAGDMEKYRQIMTERDVLSKQYTDINPEEMGYEAYRNHAGEAEARMVQARMDLTPEQLRKQFPYQYTGKEGTGLDIDPDKAIITTQNPGTINMPEQSIELPQSEVDELGFHSPLENAILKIGQPKGTGDQFLKQLEKMPGVKTEELEVSGVKKYLQDHPTVTKQELVDYMDKSRVRLENKVLAESTGEGNTYEDYQVRGGEVYHDDDYIQGLADDLHYDMKNDDVIRTQEREALLESDPERYADYETNPYSQARLEEDIDGSLWEQAKSRAEEMYYENPISHYYDDHGYDIYGNDDIGYTVKDPQGRFLDIGGRNGLYDLSDAESALRSHLLDEGILALDDAGAAKHEDYTLPGKYDNYREILTTIPENISGDVRGSKRFNELQQMIKNNQMKFDSPEYKEYDSLLKQGKSEDYTDGHYGEIPNVLAHMRVNDRYIDGKKTLMVEEIQSDLHQAGRKKGYRDESKRVNWDDPRYVQARREATDALNAFNGASDNPSLQAQLRPELERARAAEDIFASGNRRVSEGVPDAPFKKNWHEMMVKQALDMAVKEGYDAVAFTTGRQQVERYENSLRKAVDEINFNKRDDNTISVNAMKGGRETFAGIVQDGKFIDGPGKGKTIEEVLGKGIAKQINEGELLKPGSITGKDLTIGGEGMKGFYDKIIPDFINKYGKKWGMGMKKAHLDQNMSGEEFIDHLHSEGLTVKEFDALPQDKRIEIVKKGGDEVHYVDLTDAAKKDIKEKGQPLFSGLGLAPAPLLFDGEEDN